MKVTVEGVMYDVVVYPDTTAYGKWTCEVPKLPGCRAYGETTTLAVANIEAAIVSYTGDEKKEVIYWQTRYTK